MNAPFHAAADWYKGRGFDFWKAYERLQKTSDERKAARRSEHPYQSLAGEVLGGTALGARVPGLAAASAPTVGGAMATGAATGAVYGSGEAKPGERLQGAAEGAVVGGLTGGAFQKGGNMIATRAARTAEKAALPAAEDLQAGAMALKQQAMDEGVNFKQAGTQKLAANLKVAAGRPNERLRPKAAGYVDEIEQLAQGDMSFHDFDEFRKGLNKTIAKAEPEDQIALGRMKTVLDNFGDSPPPGTFTGDAKKASELYGQYKTEYSKYKKTAVIEDILDNADVKGKGNYTQAGVAKATTAEFGKLYQRIKRSQEPGWSKEEIEVIRQLAKGGESSRVLKLAAKLDPKGLISSAVGFSLLGPAGPVLGHVAGRMVEKGMENASTRLAQGVASGVMPGATTAITSRAMPLIPAAAEASTGAYQSLANQ